MARVWKFLLPQSGEHILKIDKIGTLKQRVWLDGTELDSQEGQTIGKSAFALPDGTLLRLQHSQESKEGWILLVNDRPVESVGKSGEGLRDLRSMAEGSYIIATGFSAKGVMNRDYICRVFKFLVGGTPHVVEIAHKDRTWQVAVDTEMIDQEKQRILDSSVEVEFAVPAPDGSQLVAHVEIAWNMLSWHYRLYVGDVNVPACWTPWRGWIRALKPPEVCSGYVLDCNTPTVAAAEEIENHQAIENAHQAEFTKDEFASAEDHQAIENVLASLPQGVSYDREAQAFQANIRDSKTGRFILLGEFASPESAHQAYLEALPRYSPEKAIAPALH